MLLVEIPSAYQSPVNSVVCKEFLSLPKLFCLVIEAAICSPQFFSHFSFPFQTSSLPSMPPSLPFFYIR